MRVAFLGLGAIGEPMAAHITRDPFDLTVWNRTQEKAEDFAARHSVRVAATPAAAVRDAELVITVQAKLAILARTAAPELFASAMSFINSLLPDPTTREGDQPKLGRESESEWAPSALTESTYKAAEDNNEI